MSQEKSLKDLIRNIVEYLVDEEDQVQINEVNGDQSRIIEVTVAKKDIGMVIGRQGRTADAIRTIMHAVSGKEKKRTVLQIVDRG